MQQHQQGALSHPHQAREDSRRLAAQEDKSADLTPLLASAVSLYARRKLGAP